MHVHLSHPEKLTDEELCDIAANSPGNIQLTARLLDRAARMKDEYYDLFMYRVCRTRHFEERQDDLSRITDLSQL